MANPEYQLTWDERKEKALDLIGFLAAFDVPFSDAQNILSIAYHHSKSMTAAAYKHEGKGMALFATMAQQETEGKTN